MSVKSTHSSSTIASSQWIPALSASLITLSIL
jgi:hypothetical protein